MRTSIILFASLCVLATSCVGPLPGYLPSAETLNTNEYGAYVITYNRGNVNYRGELIAVNSDSLVMLQYDRYAKDNLRVLPMDEMTACRVFYGRADKYGWAYMIPLLSISHGFWAILTLPINLIYVSAIAIPAHYTYSFALKPVSVDTLARYARFPMGIPESVDLESIE